MSEMKFIVAQNVQNNKQMDHPSPPAPTPHMLGFSLSLSLCHNEAEVLKTYSVTTASPMVQAKRMVILRRHVPNFSITEQLKMNKNTLFTHFRQNFYNMPSIYLYRICLCTYPCIENIL